MLAANKEQKDYETLCHQSILNVPFVIQIFGHLIKMLSRKNVTGQWVKKVARLIILSALIILCVKGFLDDVRSTLAFLKRIENYIGAIWYFIHHYNACLQT